MMSVVFLILAMGLIFLSLAVLWLIWQLNFHFYFLRKSSSPFECGFDVKEGSRLPFSIRFFCLLVLFLLFDVELVLLLGLPYSVLMKSMFPYLIFFIFLVAGLVEEWRRGALDWKI